MAILNYTTTVDAENVKGCECCTGDEAIYWKDNENNAFIDSKGEMMVVVKARLIRYKVKYCPNCGRKLGQRMKENKKLLPCPFCGGEVSIALAGNEADAYYFVTRGQGENACKCRVFMESEKFDKDSDPEEYARYKAELIEVWNHCYDRENEEPRNKELRI